MKKLNKEVTLFVPKKVKPILSAKQREKITAYHAAVANERATEPKHKMHYAYFGTGEKINPSNLSEMWIEYINICAGRITYTAVNTAYQNSGHPYLYKLLQMSGQTYHENERTSYENELSGKIIRAQRTVHHKKAKIGAVAIKKETVERVKKPTVYSPVKCYKRKTNGLWSVNHENGEYIDTVLNPIVEYTEKVVTVDGKKTIFGKIIPYDTLENVTETTVSEWRNVKHETYNDFDNLVFETRAYIYELVSIGLIRDFSDIWNVKVAIYRHIAKFISRERKYTKENESFSKMCIITDDDGNETITTADKAVKDIRNSTTDNELTDLFVSILEKHFSAKYSNKEIIAESVNVYKEIISGMIAGKTETEIATEMNQSHQNISKKVKTIRNIFSTNTAREMLAM